MIKKYKVMLCTCKHTGIQIVKYSGKQDIESLRDFIGEENVFTNKEISLVNFLQPVLYIKGEKMIDGLSTRVLDNTYVVKIFGYIDPSTDKETFRVMLINEAEYLALFEVKEKLNFEYEDKNG